MSSQLDEKEVQLLERLERIRQMEQEILKREKGLKEKEKSKKQMLLRLAPSLWDEIAIWAEEDFRSINGQVEYLLSESVKQKYKK